MARCHFCVFYRKGSLVNCKCELIIVNGVAPRPVPIDILVVVQRITSTGIYIAQLLAI